MRRDVGCMLVFVAAAQAGCGPGAGRRGHEYTPDMARSIAYESYAPNPVTRTGSTLQPPVRGTVARGFLPLAYAATASDAERAGRELRNPVPLTPESLADGRAAYETFCLVCHGPAGDGDGPLAGKIPNPPSYRTPPVRGYAEGRLFHVVTYGSGRMPPYAAQLTRDERWKVVHYVRTLQGGEASK